MNKSVIYTCISFPNTHSIKHEEELKEVTSNFPYFQTAQILLAYSLKAKEDYRFSNQLKVSSLQAYDRKALWELLNKKRREEESEFVVEKKEKLNELTPLVEQIKKETPINEIEIQDTVLLLETEKTLHLPRTDQKKFAETEIKITEQNNAHTFSEWLRIHRNASNSNINSGNEAPQENQRNKSELIEKFIQTDPRISKPTKATFFSPQVMAKKSIEENDEIVSETLANIYASQGDVQRAVRVYKKLGLLNPEKSAYFAALIKKLENTELT